MTVGTVAGNQGIAVRALVCASCEFEVTERTVEVQGQVAMWANFIILIDRFATRRTKGSPTLAAKSIFKKELTATCWTFAAECRRQNRIDFCNFRLILIIFYQ